MKKKASETMAENFPVSKRQKAKRNSNKIK